MPAPDGHAGHDPLLVAAYAAGDASGADLEQATALVSSCPECARLHRDLRALSAALASAPAPTRSRDFRLTAEQAADLSRPAGWRRLLAPLAGARSAAGPVAASLAALGLAGLLLGGGIGPWAGGAATSALAPAVAATAAPAVPNAASGNFDTSVGQGTTSGAAPVPSAAASAAAAMAAPSEAPAASTAASAPSVALSVPSPLTSPASGSEKTSTIASSGGSGPSAGPSGAGEGYVAPARPFPSAAGASAPPPEQGSGPSPLVLGSLLLLVAGVVLGVLRLAARRLV